MPRKRIYELAKEWRVASRAILDQLRKVGSTATTAHNTVTNEEVAKVKALLGVTPPPAPVIGEQRVVSERVVAQPTDGTTAATTTTEQVVERRVQVGVIRRRTTRVAVPQEMADIIGEKPVVADVPVHAVPPPSEESLPRAFEVPPIDEAFVPFAMARVEDALVRAVSAEMNPQQDTVVTAVPKKEAVRTPPVVAAPAQPSPRVLGRIDLRKTVHVPYPPQRSALLRQAPITVQWQKPAPGTPLEKKPTPVSPLGIRKPQRPRPIVVHPSAVTKRNAGEERFFRGLQKRKSVIGKPLQPPIPTIPKASKRVIKVAEVITVADLAKEIGVKATEVIAKLFSLGVLATINHVLDVDTATLAAAEFGYTVENVSLDVEALFATDTTPSTVKDLRPRPPVVTVMGHVDHGKTSLLDAIRHTHVTAHEAGGITQHIGAYDVTVNDRRITFLDTPGHEAFTAMRARGALVTDIVVLVVAADDGVMPQTIEAINHARAAKVPFVVAITKIDKSEANVERIKQAVANYGVVPEEWGGDALFVPVSAKTGEGLPTLLEMLILQADVLELQAVVSGPAKGTVVEAKLDKGRGPVATVLIHAGTLKVGDPCVCGAQYGKVRALFDSRGQRVTEATPTMPVEVLGLGGVPAAGDALIVARDEIQARQVAEHRQGKQRVATLTTKKKLSLADLGQAAVEQKELRVVLKADMQGSIEALKDAVQRLSTDEVKLSVLHASAGAISETDVLLATASKALTIGFHVRPTAKAAKLAEREGVEIRLYEIIYEVLADVHAALEGLLTPVYSEKLLGSAEVRQVFTIPRVGVIAGSVVTTGKMLRTAHARLIRDRITVYQGQVGSLRRFKDDVREVAVGYECGIGLENWQAIYPGDVIEAFEQVQVLRRLEPQGQRGEARLLA